MFLTHLPNIWGQSHKRTRSRWRKQEISSSAFQTNSHVWKIYHNKKVFFHRFCSYRWIRHSFVFVWKQRDKYSCLWTFPQFGLCWSYTLSNQIHRSDSLTFLLTSVVLLRIPKHHLCTLRFCVLHIWSELLWCGCADDSVLIVNSTKSCCAKVWTERPSRWWHCFQVKEAKQKSWRHFKINSKSTSQPGGLSCKKLQRSQEACSLAGWSVCLVNRRALVQIPEEHALQQTW